MKKNFRSKSILLFAACLSLISANGNTKNGPQSSATVKISQMEQIKKHQAKRLQHHNPEIKHITSGNINDIIQFAHDAVYSTHFHKYIAAKKNASKCGNTMKLMSFMPSMNSQWSFGKQIYDKGKLRHHTKFTQRKNINLTFVDFKLGTISSMVDAAAKSKADSAEYKEELSKFCLTDIIEPLIDLIIQKANTDLRRRITNSKRAMLKKVKARIETGTMNVSDLYSAEADLASSETELFINENKENLLRDKIKSVAPDFVIPTRIGFIPKLENWETNKSAIVANSLLLKKERETKKHTVAQATSEILNVTPSVQAGVSFTKEVNDLNKATGQDKWDGSLNITISHEFGMNNVLKMVQGAHIRKSAIAKFLETLRKEISNGHEVYISTRNGLRECEMRIKTLNHHEKSLESKQALFNSGLQLSTQRRVSIDDVVYQEGNVIYSCTQVNESLAKAAKNYFKLMHMKGELI